MHYIHTSAAAAFARKRGLENITPLLLEEIETLQKKLQSEEKLLKMAVLQLKIEKESHIRQNITDQVHQNILFWLTIRLHFYKKLYDF